jgi:hypothetical protein
MAARGRPPLTEDAVRAKIAAYCARYRVGSLTEAGLPPFPTGKRETRQHREWIGLYKALQRLQRRQQKGDPILRAAALKSQKGRCPICLETLDQDAVIVVVIVIEGAPSRAVVVHPICGELVRLVQRLGPSVLDRLRDQVRPPD